MIYLSDKAVKEFQTLYFERFNDQISREQAEADLFKLMRLIVASQPAQKLELFTDYFLNNSYGSKM